MVTKLGKKLCHAVLNLIAAIVFGTVLLALAYALPTEQINEHVQESAAIMEKEGTYPTLFQNSTSILDNWSDAIMLLEAAYTSDEPIFDQIMLAKRGAISKCDPAQTIVKHYVNGNTYDDTEEYARYWHGYLVVLKPLLQVLNYGQIRAVNMTVQLLLTALVFVLLWRKTQKAHAVSWLLIYAMMAPFALGKSMFFSACFYITNLAVIAILATPQKKLESISGMIFLNIGIAVAYFDLLSYPIVTFVVPAAVRLLLLRQKTFKEALADLIKLGCLWILGYAGMWAAKWLIATCITGENVIASGLAYVAKRTSAASISDEYVNNAGTEMLQKGRGAQALAVITLRTNWHLFIETPVTYALLAWLVLLPIRFFMANGQSRPQHSLTNSMLLSALAILPIVWILCTVNHSAIHVHFTNKVLAATFLPVLLMLGETVAAAEGARPAQSEPAIDPIRQGAAQS